MFYKSQMNPNKFLENTTFSVHHYILPVTPFKKKVCFKFVFSVDKQKMANIFQTKKYMPGVYNI